ncbi:MAG: LysR family transcriptional regulator [Spirochaetales bacterium]|jgi:DNA-binding transcriptional LysR family regulator|nr:LysR family transcriptional regulator [Spirochaetales bacterium]
MNTLFFKYAIEIERTRSITRAAENLYMAQPNLSKAIKELEDTIGFSIFERNSRGVFPTNKGLAFLEYAQRILEHLELISKLANAENSEYQNFSISIPRGSYISTGFLKFLTNLDFEKELNINIQETNSLQTITNVMENKFNLGIIRYQMVYENYFLDYIADKKLSYEQIWEFEYLALMSKKHFLAGIDKVEYNKLKHCVEIVHGDTCVPYLNVADIKQKNLDDMPQKRIYLYERCNQFDILNSISTTYMWASPIPESLLKRYELVQRKCVYPNNKYKDLLIYPKGYCFSAMDKKFIDKLYETKNEVSLKQYS